MIMTFFIILWKHAAKEQSREFCFETGQEHVPEGSEQQKYDRDLTLEEWKDMPREILTLKCNQHRLLASGSKTSLANHLFSYFALDHASTARTRSAPDDRRKSSAVSVPVIPDVPQASKDIF